MDKQATGTGFPFLFVIIANLVPIRASPAPNLTQGGELWCSLSLWLRVYLMHWSLLSHTLHLNPITINGTTPHWREEDPIEFGHYQRDGELLAYSCIWSMMDFTVPWKYLVMK